MLRPRCNDRPRGFGPALPGDIAPIPFWIFIILAGRVSDFRPFEWSFDADMCSPQPGSVGGLELLSALTLAGCQRLVVCRARCLRWAQHTTRTSKGAGRRISSLTRAIVYVGVLSVFFRDGGQNPSPAPTLLVEHVWVPCGVCTLCAALLCSGAHRWPGRRQAERLGVSVCPRSIALCARNIPSLRCAPTQSLNYPCTCSCVVCGSCFRWWLGCSNRSESSGDLVG